MLQEQTTKYAYLQKLISKLECFLNPYPGVNMERELRKSATAGFQFYMLPLQSPCHHYENRDYHDCLIINIVCMTNSQSSTSNTYRPILQHR